MLFVYRMYICLKFYFFISECHQQGEILGTMCTMLMAIIQKGESDVDIDFDDTDASDEESDIDVSCGQRKPRTYRLSS